MGAEFNEHYLTAKDAAEAKKVAAEIQADLRAEFGDGRYQGHLGTVPGVRVVGRRFSSLEEAILWAQDHHEKWEPALLVQADGDNWVMAAWCPC